MLLAAGKTEADLVRSTRRMPGVIKRLTESNKNRRTPWPRMSRRAASLLKQGGISRTDAFKIHYSGILESNNEGPLQTSRVNDARIDC
jgi:hypothetical protein